MEYITGKCKWAKVITPEANTLKNNKMQYSIILVVDEKTREEFTAKGVKGKSKAPDKDGDWNLSFATNAEFPNGDPSPLIVVDKNNKPVTELVGNGSEVKVAYNEFEYTQSGGGVTLLLKGVQVLDLVKFESNATPNFSNEGESGTDENPFS
jgi:hypothetical protein